MGTISQKTARELLIVSRESFNLFDFTNDVRYAPIIKKLRLAIKSAEGELNDKV